MEQMILIHGALGNEQQMFSLKNILSESMDVHVLEFEGHGSTSDFTEPFTTSSFIQQLENKINELDNPPNIFGYSMGGFVALLTAVTKNVQIRSITTLGTKMKWNPAIAEKEMRNLNPDLIAEKVPGFASALEKSHGVHWKEVVLRTSNFMKTLGDTSPISKEAMHNIAIPIQLLLADQDRMVSREETEEVYGWIKNSAFHLIDNSYHQLEKVNIEVLEKKIKVFIESN